MINLPLKTRQRILRKARMIIATSTSDYIIAALIMSYRSAFKHMSAKEIYNSLPELRFVESDNWESYKRNERINLLSDAINKLNQKIKEESKASSSTGVDEHAGSGAGGKKAHYRVNPW